MVSDLIRSSAMTDNSDSSAMILRRRLKQIGLSDPAVNAAWPSWWSDDAEGSASAETELRFSLARKLGLDARSLIDEAESPRFVWRDEARFKHVTTEDEQELSAISSFGKALAHALISAMPANQSMPLPGATALREILLRRGERPFVRLSDLLSVAWSVSIPVVHLRVFPLEQKRMAAMAVNTGKRNAILLGKDSTYPAQVAFYLAHELGHIALGHLKHGNVLVDMDSELTSPAGDTEEAEADRFALELLTGQANLTVLPFSKHYTARQLARDALHISKERHIEPGTLALCFGYSSGDWPTAMAAMHYIYESPKPVWNEVNQIANKQLSFAGVSEDTASYISAVLGGVSAS
jgi:IrrE N-terminal-like domain